MEQTQILSRALLPEKCEYIDSRPSGTSAHGVSMPRFKEGITKLNHYKCRPDAPELSSISFRDYYRKANSALIYRCKCE
ncbi:hypothetical protein NADE_003426 [Nannochloris sp. 'desiccata']|nr:hypothetical protein NADE_003426 [Chlorella desiccata (nom. nud.)]